MPRLTFIAVCALCLSSPDLYPLNGPLGRISKGAIAPNERPPPNYPDDASLNFPVSRDRAFGRVGITKRSIISCPELPPSALSPNGNLA